MKKNITIPQVKIVRFDACDIISTSIEGGSPHDKTVEGGEDNNFAPGRNSSLWD